MYYRKEVYFTNGIAKEQNLKIFLKNLQLSSNYVLQHIGVLPDSE